MLDPGAAPTFVGFGSAPALSPDGRRIAVVNDVLVAVIDVEAGTSTSVDLSESPAGGGISSVAWSADGRRLLVLGWGADGARIVPFDSETLLPGPPVVLGVASDAATMAVSWAGNGRDGDVAIAVVTPEATEVRYLDPATLVEIEGMRRTLPAGATSVRIGLGGSVVVWVEGGHLVIDDGDGTPRRVEGVGVTSAWFIR